MLDTAPSLALQPETCLACGTSAPPQALYQVRGFPIVRCSACGLGRTLIPHDFDPAEIYTRAYFQGGQRDGYADYQGSHDSLAAEFRHVLADIATAGATQGRLLEIGCAYGFFMEEARAFFQVSGVELAEDAVAACRARGLEVVRRADEAFYGERGPFDVVVMLDVIEHLTNPADLLRELHRHTRRGGLLVITTGDFGSLVARTMGRHWRLMTPPQHLWYFTAEAISRLLAAHGFRLLRVTHPAKRVPLGLIAYQLARYLGVQGVLRGRTLPGTVRVNLADAMRVVAERV
jgi:2-polyprenyl-3-methyl-5-hydroxy-6-metoxy-1,4-benzoquinol methylase